MSSSLLGKVAVFVFVAAACAPVTPVATEPCVSPEAPDAGAPAEVVGDLAGLGTELVVRGLVEPTDVIEPPGLDALLVTEKPGRIVVIRDGRVLDEPLLDIEDSVSSDFNERGLLSIRAHPNFGANCRLFLFFTDSAGDSQIVEGIVSGTSPPTIDPDSLRLILQIPQKHRWHQSGSMIFGPDGYLWVSIGDGGGIGDPEGNGQNPRTLKGTVLKLDIDTVPYTVPSDNPFVESSEGRPEVWAFGLRNPWRISIDPETRLLYLPDVGQADFEELNIVSLSDGGANFGWPVTEGPSCFEDEECDTAEFTMPAYDYAREGGNCAIIGGSVYRGSAIPELDGQYFFADFCGGWIRTLTYEKGQITSETDWEPQLGRLGMITSFGTDAAGELYVTTFEGDLLKIVPVRESGAAEG
jgi:glucose/arabinose dehydrogenase